MIDAYSGDILRKGVFYIKCESQEYWAGLIKMSLSRFFILHVLHRQPLHGYEITRQAAALTNGCCAPTEGSLYPVLKEFTDAGLVNVVTQVVSGRERKVCTLTPRGEQAYQVALRAWGEVAGYILRAVKNDGAPTASESNTEK